MSNSNFRNFTPHAITFFNPEWVVKKGYSYSLVSEDFKEQGYSLPPEIEGGARATQNEESCGTLGNENITVGVFKMSYGEPVGLPEDVADDDVIIVSKITADAAREHGYKYLKNLYLVAHTVRDKEGQIIGCTDLAQYS